MKCNCRDWCRDDLAGELINGKRYPIPNHARGCNAYTTEEFLQIEFEGSTCVVEKYEADSFPASEGYSTKIINLSRDQFERMEEFGGF